MSADRAYLDYNATSPLRPQVRDAMLAAYGRFGNPSSVHAEGRAARALVEAAREAVASTFSVKASQVYFTSGGTEAANWLLHRPMDRNGDPVTRVIAPATEHSCVLQANPIAPLHIDTAPVSASGLVDLAWLESGMAAGSAVLAVQAANSETGVLQPLSDIAKAARSANAIIVTDAVQAVGRLPETYTAGADAFFFSAHKFGGPKGIGAVVLNGDRASFAPLLRGGGQEARQRSGTENVAGIAGLAAALTVAVADRRRARARQLDFRTAIETGIRTIDGEAVVFGDAAPRLPNTTCFAVPGLAAETALIAFDLDGVSLSSGSACSSGKVERSHVLEAMGIEDHLIRGAMRVSTGWETSDSGIERFLAALQRLCGKRRGTRAG